MSKKPDKAPAAFTARAEYNEKTIQAFCKVQFSAFQTKKQLGILVLSLLMILIGVSGKLGYAAAAIFVPVGCFMLMYLNYIPKTDADRLIKACDGIFPVSRYSFTDTGFDIVSGSGTNSIGYESITRLIEDDDYLFFFATPQVAYIVERASLSPNDVRRFKAYTQKRVGGEWTQTRPWYSINLAELVKGRKRAGKSK